MPDFELAKIDDYEEIVGTQVVKRIREKAKPLHLGLSLHLMGPVSHWALGKLDENELNE